MTKENNEADNIEEYLNRVAADTLRAQLKLTPEEILEQAASSVRDFRFGRLPLEEGEQGGFDPMVGDFVSLCRIMPESFQVLFQNSLRHLQNRDVQTDSRYEILKKLIKAMVKVSIGTNVEKGQVPLYQEFAKKLKEFSDYYHIVL